MVSPLRLGLLASGAWALAVLAGLELRARSYGPARPFAPPAADPRKGLAWAFGRGLWPSAKESARENLPTWFAGVGYHLGILAGFAYLVLLLAGPEPEGALRRGFRVPLLAGALCGGGLLAKRIVVPRLRALSCPDDFLSNLLTTGFLALAFARTIFPGMEAVLLTEATLLLLWLPLGKIRHCLFFFTSRYHMAVHFGRRGTFPPASDRG